MQVFDCGYLWGGAGGSIYALALTGTERGSQVVRFPD